MASVTNINIAPGTGGQHHQRSKSSVIRSFIGHRRNNSDGAVLQPAVLIPTAPNASGPELSFDMGMPGFSRQPRALGELQQNQQDQGSRSPKKSRDDGRQSPTKSTFATISLKSLAAKESEKVLKTRDTSPTKSKKTKSSTNLAGLLLRPKSSKNLNKLADEEAARAAKDKENRTPPSSVANDHAPPPPIFAQFTTQNPPSPTVDSIDPFVNHSSQYTTSGDHPCEEGIVMKQRPKSFHPSSYVSTQDGRAQLTDSRGRGGKPKHALDEKAQKRRTWGKGETASRAGVLGVFPGLGSRTKSTKSVNSELSIDPKDIDKHLEAMLDRRNIPENQRYKMRNLTDTIKMEFVRQDWAETQAKSDRPGTDGSDTSMEAGNVATSDPAGTKKKHRSMTLSKGASKAPASPTKKSKPEGTLGRHFRSKSTESVVNERPTSSGSSSSTGIFAKAKGQQRPLDFVAYLRKVQRPEIVEVGKLHKLRILLRNETVTWTEEFIRQGGMKEIVDLLHRIIKVEWREEHEDALLHENLLCLKALCTTALALQYLHSIQATLFPALVHMIFDPEKKGPSEFTTRNIITSVLLTYIECATPQERLSRAQTVLRYLRDPEAKEDERPVSFVLEMRRDRPYRIWCKEVVNVTKEVFWIFLHNLNVVALASAGEKKPSSPSKLATTTDQPTTTTSTEQGLVEGGSSTGAGSQFGYLARHFPQERPPVAAAPYVGGVEWEATNYLASHLDLMNAILACTGPTAEQRNQLRGELRISGWERCMGGSLRLCKEKFYGAVHDGLRRWVAAAAEDGWDVRDVRYGPAPESRSASPAKKAGGGRPNKEKETPPKLEMPKLDFALDRKGADNGHGNDAWLS